MTSQKNVQFGPLGACDLLRLCDIVSLTPTSIKTFNTYYNKPPLV